MKLVVVGGVAAGASTAARARRLDESAEIIVFERGHHVSFANCGLPYHVGEVIADRSRLLLQTPESLRESLNIDVRIATEVISIDRKKKTVTVRECDTAKEYTESYDKLALCMGAEAMKLPMPGVDLPAVNVLRRIGDMDLIKARLDAALLAQKAGRRGVVIPMPLQRQSREGAAIVLGGDRRDRHGSRVVRIWHDQSRRGGQPLETGDALPESIADAHGRWLGSGGLTGTPGWTGSRWLSNRARVLRQPARPRHLR